MDLEIERVQLIATTARKKVILIFFCVFLCFLQFFIFLTFYEFTIDYFSVLLNGPYACDTILFRVFQYRHLMVLFCITRSTYLLKPSKRSTPQWSTSKHPKHQNPFCCFSFKKLVGKSFRQAATLSKLSARGIFFANTFSHSNQLQLPH